MHSPPRILVVDDIRDNRDMLRARLESQGYDVREAAGGWEALAAIAAEPPDLVLLDVMMDDLDGITTVRRIKADAALPFVPVILLTARTETTDIVAGLDAGADEYLTKPVDHAALVARVKAALRLKALQDKVVEQAATLRHQADELAGWNRALEQRVAAQIEELDRMGRLKRFLAPQVVDSILSSPDGEALLSSHRRDVAVLFCDLRGFTAFSATAEPEDLIALLGQYHAIVGDLVFRHGGTLERFTGDAIMVLFNDPLPTPDYCLKAADLALDILEQVEPLVVHWRTRGQELGVGVGIAAGFATLGKIGFQGRYDYAAIGSVTNIASRLSGYAKAGQVLVTARIAQEIAAARPILPLPPIEIRGIAQPVPVAELAGRPAPAIPSD